MLTDVSEEDVQAAGSCAIVSINTNTRSALPEDARRRVEKLLRVMQKDKERTADEARKDLSGGRPEPGSCH